MKRALRKVLRGGGSPANLPRESAVNRGAGAYASTLRPSPNLSCDGPKSHTSSRRRSSSSCSISHSSRTRSSANGDKSGRDVRHSLNEAAHRQLPVPERSSWRPPWEHGPAAPNESLLSSFLALCALAAAASSVARRREDAAGVACDYTPDVKLQDIYWVPEDSLGSGTFGTVTTAIHKTTGEIVAVKRIPRTPDLSFEEISWEVEVLKIAGEHRNITQFYDIFQDDGCYYLTMEMARGGELFDLLIENGPPDEADTAMLMKSLVGAVAFVHMHGIVHGDIKPENVFLTNSCAGDVDWAGVRLGDFGSSVEVALGGRTMLSGLQTRGTVAYNPPESLQRMLRQQDVVVSAAGDVWALGVVLFMLLTGEHPFAPDMSVTDEEMARCVLEADESALFQATEDEEEDGYISMRETVSPLAKDLIASMLRKDPAKRATAHDVVGHPWLRIAPTWSSKGGRMVTDRHELEKHGAAPPASPEDLQKFWSARRRVKALLMAVMVGLVDDAFFDVVEEEDDSDRRLVGDAGPRSSKSRRKGPGQSSSPRPWPPTEGDDNKRFTREEVEENERLMLGPPAAETCDSADAASGGEKIMGEADAKAAAERARAELVQRKRERVEELAAAIAVKTEEAKEATAKAALMAAHFGDKYGLAETMFSADDASFAIGQKEDLERDHARAVRELDVASVTGEDLSPPDPREKKRPPYPIGSREAACGMIDRGDKGYVTGGDIQWMTSLFGERMNQAEIRAMMKAVDGDPATESNRIPYEQLVRVVPPLCPPKEIAPGEKLYLEGDVDPTLYLLTKGVVEFSVSCLQGKAPLQRQGPGVSFGEVELLREDGGIAPRLATCKCLGEPGGGGCEVLLVTGHTWDLLTDVFNGIRFKLMDQTVSRLTQLAGSVLRNAFHGEESSMMGLDVIWGQKESTSTWNSVVPSRRTKTGRPIPAGAAEAKASSSSSSASSSNAAASAVAAAAAAAPVPRESQVAPQLGASSDDGDMPTAMRAVSWPPPPPLAASLAFAGGGSSRGLTSSEDGVASRGGRDDDDDESVNVAEAAAARAEEEAAAAVRAALTSPAAAQAAAGAMATLSDLRGAEMIDPEADKQGSFALLVLEGSVTAVYDGEEDSDGRGGGTVERVLEPGDFCFCGDGFGPDAPQSPSLVTCKLWQRARVWRVPANEFTDLMKKKTMQALTEFMFAPR